MRLLWTLTKIFAGVAITVCMLALALVFVFPTGQQHGSTLLIAIVLAGAVYFFSNRKIASLGEIRPQRVVQWRGECLVLRTRWVRYTVLVITFVVAAALFGFLTITHHPRGTTEHWLIGLSLLVFSWLTLVSSLGLMRRHSAGFALQINDLGVTYPGVPLVPWSIVRGVSIVPPSPDSDTGQSLVLQVNPMPERPLGCAYWFLSSLPGASFGPGTVSMPLYLMQMDPKEVLSAANEFWRRNR